jgi:hypothetical protein
MDSLEMDSVGNRDSDDENSLPLLPNDEESESESSTTAHVPEQANVQGEEEELIIIQGAIGSLSMTHQDESDSQVKAARNCTGQTGYLGVVLSIMMSLWLFNCETHAAPQENIIFESIGEMAGATSYLHVQATISLSSITKQFELYKNKLKGRFTDPQRVATVMNQQFAKNLNVTVEGYLDEKLKDTPPSKKMFQQIPAPHMNTAVVWTRIAQLHFEDLYEIGLNLAALKSLLPRVPLENRDRIVASANFFKNIQPLMRQDNIITDDHEVENEFLEKYPDLHVPNHLSKRFRRSFRTRMKRTRFDHGMSIFHPPNHTRLEDWFLMKVQENTFQDSYWFHVCMPEGNETCQNHPPIPQVLVPENGWFEGLAVDENSEPPPIPQAYIAEAQDYLTLGVSPLSAIGSLPEQWEDKFMTQIIQNHSDWEKDLATHVVQNPAPVSIAHPGPSGPKTERHDQNRKRSMGKPSMNMGFFHLPINEQDNQFWKKQVSHVSRLIPERRKKREAAGDGTVQIRTKRLAGLIALPIAIAASAMGIYNAVQIEYLKSQLTEIKENTGRLFSVVDNHENAIQDLEAGMNMLTGYMIQLFEQNPALLDARFSRIENQLRDRIRQATHALQAAQHRRLSVDLLSPNQVHEMFAKLNSRAAEFNCELLIKFPSDLLQLEVSLLYDGEDAHLLLHVPMMPKESVLRLFRLHPFPLPFFGEHFLIPDVKNDVLAVSSTDQRLHVQLSSIDLMGCHRMNQLFLCDQFGVLSQKFNKTCLGALYMQNFKTAQELCEFVIEPVSEKVYPLRKNRFLVYLPAALTVPIKCVNGTKTEKHLGAGSQTFTLSSGCEAQFLEHLVLSDLNIKMPADVLHFTWDWTPADLFEHNEDKVAPQLKKLETLGMNRPKLKDLRYHMSASSMLSGWHDIILYVIGGILLATALGIGIYVCCKHRKEVGGNSNAESGVFTNLLALMGLQQHHARQQENIRVRYDNNSQVEEDRNLHFEQSQRYPNIGTQPDRLLERLQNMSEEMEQLKTRNTLLESNPKRQYPTAPSVQNPNLF